MGRNVATSRAEVVGVVSAAAAAALFSCVSERRQRELSELATREARVVFPDPGIPLTATRYRLFAGRLASLCWSLSTRWETCSSMAAVVVGLVVVVIVIVVVEIVGKVEAGLHVQVR